MGGPWECENEIGTASVRALRGLCVHPWGTLKDISKLLGGIRADIVANSRDTGYSLINQLCQGDRWGTRSPGVR